MKIEKIEIKGLFGKKDISWTLNPQVNVLVGVNGSGKSTILSTVHHLLLSKDINDDIDKFILNEARIYFTDKTTKEYLPISIEDLKEYAEEAKHSGKTGEVFLIALTAIFLSSDLFNNNDRTEFPKKIVGLNNQNLYIDLIEANLTNSNANQNFTRSNRKEENVLDLEIRETIDELNKIKTDELIDRLSGSLNVFFNQIGKHVSYENHELVYTDTQLQKKLNYSHLSSGERQLIYILLRVALSNGDKSKTAIILMDEPEISLHVNWQAHFIKQLTILNPDAQFIIVTHSPAIIMNGWNDVYVNMEDITQ